MTFFLGLICGFILLTIAMFHIYWALGGRFGIEEVLPTKNNIDKVILPNAFITFMVAVVFIGITLLYLNGAGIYKVSGVSEWVKQKGLLLFAIVFMIRAIGEFRYVGFFKRIKNTRFGINDTKYFSPLCAFLSIGGLLIYFLN